MSCCAAGLAAILPQEAAEHPSPFSRGGNELLLCLSVVARVKASAMHNCQYFSGLIWAEVIQERLSVMGKK